MSRLAGVRVSDSLAKKSDATVGGYAVPPETEYYGFALYVGSSLAFMIYLLWAYLPQDTLHALNIYYYPSRWWALALPVYLMVAVAFVYVYLGLYNVEVLTRPTSSLENVTDQYQKVVAKDEVNYYLQHPSDGVWDLPLAEVSHVLYGSRS